MNLKKMQITWFFFKYSMVKRGAAAERYRIPRNQFRVVYNGIDFDHIQAKRERGEIIRELGLEQDVRIVGTTVHIREWKRIDKLVYLAKNLDRKTFVLVLGDGPDLKRLKRLTHDLYVSEKVIFLGMKANPFDYVNAMDVFVLPSGSDESFGNSAVEAMALGVPTVVFKDGGGLVEHIVPNVTGYVVNDDRDLYETVSRLLDDPPLRTRVGQAGKDHVRTKYSVENMITAYYDLYGLKYTGEAITCLSNTRE